ncbi:glycosyltransferase [Polymorphobacter multimanifer]|uniref:glycosyltransferase n=1 Tax=Polymorphobacter multimanifer TaxID=1070431 RepID=UPI00166F3D3B|nr:glycosyltransferase [Polymorphobacter multimanifer]
MSCPQPRASVVIPHLNTPDLLARCLQSVLAQVLDTGSFEVIVVDNGSSRPLAPVEAAFPAVRFLREARPGPGHARNTGIAAASAATIVCIDADCRAAPGWLQAAVEAVEADPDHPAGGEITIDFVDPARLTGIEAYEAVFGFRQRMYIEAKQFSVTANLATARSLHAKIGPFGGIDIAEALDWGKRAHAAGHATRFVPALHVLHPARPDMAALKRKWQRHIRHDWTERQGPMLHWYVRALALLLSVPVEAVKLVTSPRVHGVGNRLRGVGVLAAIRMFRAAEMLRVAANPAGSGADHWNRAA